MFKQKLFLFLLFLTVGIFLYRVFQDLHLYTKPFDAKYWQYRYDHSQWISPSDCKNVDPHINPKTCAWDDAWYEAHKNDPFVKHEVISLGDDGLYSHVGWQLITGKDPSSLNAEIPPFGKYLIGLSILLFKNQNIYALIMGVFVLITLYMLNITIFKDKLLAIIPVTMFSLEQLFYEQLRAPFLDLQMLLFLLLTFLFFLRKHYVLSGIMLGFFTATKAPFLTFLVIASFFSYLLLTKQRNMLRQYAFSLVICFVIYLLCYSAYFIYGHSLKEFFSLQKWIVSFYSSGTKAPFYGMVFPMLLAGTWHTWWGTVEQIKEWWIGWNVLASFSLVSIVLLTKQLHNQFPSFIFIKTDMQKAARFISKKDMKNDTSYSGLYLIGLWVLFYVGFLFFVPVWPRYLLLLLPFLYNLAIWVITKKNLQKYLRL